MADILSFDKMFYTNFEPKMKNRYIMELTDTSIPSFTVSAANRPSIQFETVKIDHINVYRKLKGKGEWQDLEITLYDPIVPSAAQAVMEWIRLHHESATGRDGYSSFYKKEIRLHQLSPLGEVVEEWILKGAYITTSNFGSLDWSSEEVVKIELTLRYDWAFLNF